MRRRAFIAALGGAAAWRLSRARSRGMPIIGYLRDVERSCLRSIPNACETRRHLQPSRYS